jgi:hypothetical protein
MRPEAIFGPMCILALWTIAILALTAYRRIDGTLRGRIPYGAFRMGESGVVPNDVSVLNRNFMNLLEMPVLFYAVCIALYVTRQVEPALVVLAWLYIFLRLVHSLIHLTSNDIIQRLASFALSNLVVMALWIWFVIRVI